MTQESNEPVIRQAFEAALIKGLAGEIVVGKEGPVLGEDGSPLLATPEASFLSVVRAYLKDIVPTGAAKLPQTGKPRENGLLDQFLKTQGKGLPFGRAQ